MKGRLVKTGGPIPILVADDNPVNLMLTREILESSGYSVDTAENGRQAVEAFLKKRYACVLMDAEMPVMGGMEAVRAIRDAEEKNPVEGQARISIACITAHPETDFCERAIRAGFDNCIKKPVDYSDLLTKLAEWTKIDQGCGRIPECCGPDAQGGEAVFDLSKALVQFGNDRELLVRLVSTFLKNAATQISIIEKANRAEDLAAMIHEAHSIRGAGVTLAAARLSKAAAALERAASEGRSNSFGELILELRQSLAGFGEHVRNLNLIMDEK
ncbi:MAG: response regulator [Deltaproteobacteria bacterium]|nr:response regulator [Deltaproteobacteria bacterium]